VRFGRRKSNWTNPARIFWGERGADSNGQATLEPDERSALQAALEEEDALNEEDVGTFTPDPTERLLSALGRFQRQLAKAENGAAADEWTDECIEHIILGIEIAHDNGWSSIREALTDTARVLQSYEEAGGAADSVGFLHDSYEILCLMVGDIIVDNTGQGVVNKWRQRYQRALEDLQDAGIPLIDDNGEAVSPLPEVVETAVAAPDVPEITNDWEDFLAARDASAREETASEAPWEERGEGAITGGADDDIDGALDEDDSDGFVLPSLAEERQATQELAETDAATDAALAEDDEHATFELEDDPTEDAGHLGDDAPALAPLEDFEYVADAEVLVVDTEVVEELDDEIGSDAVAETVEETAEPEAATTVSEDEAETPDLAAEDLEDEEDSADETPELNFEHQGGDEGAGEDDLLEFAEVPASPEGAALHQESLFDLDDADESETETTFEETTDQETSEDLFDDDADVAADDAPETVAEAPAEAPIAVAGPAHAPDSAEALLQTVQEAMARGDVANAKALALKLAAQMAGMEVSKAESSVQAAEGQLAANRDAIAEAEAEVAAAEEALRQMEEAIAARQQEAAKQRERIDEVRGQMAGVEEEIASIEAQIRELEAKRDVERARLEELDAALNSEMTAESRIAGDLDALADSESRERERLEDVRAGVGRLEQERSEREAALAEAEAMLQARRHSAGEITRTLGDDGTAA